VLVAHQAEAPGSDPGGSEFESRVRHAAKRGITAAPVCAYRAVRLFPARRFMESEPARVPGLAANECAAMSVAFESSALRRGG
jgi:hypothetical protein